MALNKALGTDLSALAQIIQSKGRGKDTVLAHITPQEAALLKRRGGRGSTNPDTGLPEYDDGLSDIGVSEAQQNAPLPSGTEALPEAGIAATPYTEGLATGAGTASQIGATQDAADIAAAQGIGTVPPGQAITGGLVGQGTVYSPTGGLYSPAQLDQLAVGQTPTTPKAPEQGIGKDALAALSKPDTLGRLGLAGALGTFGALQGKQASAQSAQAAAQKSALAQPYKEQGKELIGAAQRGELTQANQQVIQQQRARLAQAASNMGGVGQQQIENQISTLTAQLLQNQYDYGLKVLNIGDNIELGAINTQLQLDAQLNAANKSFYMGLGNLVAGSPRYIVPTSTTGNT